MSKPYDFYLIRSTEIKFVEEVSQQKKIKRAHKRRTENIKKKKRKHVYCRKIELNWKRSIDIYRSIDSKS